MEFPMTVLLMWPMWNGFAMFGEEYSTMTFLPAPISVLPKSSPLPEPLPGYLDELLLGNEHVHISVNLLHLFEQRRVRDALCDALGDEAAPCAAPGQLEAWERIVSHLCILRHFNHVLNLRKLEAFYLLRNQLCDFILKFTIVYLLL